MNQSSRIRRLASALRRLREALGRRRRPHRREHVGAERELAHPGD